MGELVALLVIVAVPAAVALFSQGESGTLAQRADKAYRDSVAGGPWRGRVVFAAVACLVPIIGFSAFGLSGLVVGMIVWIGLVYLIVRLDERMAS